MYSKTSVKSQVLKHETSSNSNQTLTPWTVAPRTFAPFFAVADICLLISLEGPRGHLPQPLPCIKNVKNTGLFFPKIHHRLSKLYFHGA
jgi:hypothetical protein